MDVIASYLPKQMSDEELKNIVQATITETGASSIKDYGKSNWFVSKKVAGQAGRRSYFFLSKRIIGRIK